MSYCLESTLVKRTIFLQSHSRNFQSVSHEAAGRVEVLCTCSDSSYPGLEDGHLDRDWLNRLITCGKFRMDISSNATSLPDVPTQWSIGQEDNLPRASQSLL
jgi:hypothetical protein